jgi:hypothetical protein
LSLYTFVEFIGQRAKISGYRDQGIGSAWEENCIGLRMRSYFTVQANGTEWEEVV